MAAAHGSRDGRRYIPEDEDEQ